MVGQFQGRTRMSYIYKDDCESNFLLAHPKMAQLVKIPFIVFHLARLMFTGQSSHLDVVNP